MKIQSAVIYIIGFVLKSNWIYNLIILWFCCAFFCCPFFSKSNWESVWSNNAVRWWFIKLKNTEYIDIIMYMLCLYVYTNDHVVSNRDKAQALNWKRKIKIDCVCFSLLSGLSQFNNESSCCVLFAVWCCCCRWFLLSCVLCFFIIYLYYRCNIFGWMYFLRSSLRTTW